MSENGSMPNAAPLELLLGADDTYAMPLAVAVFSALESLTPKRRVHITLVDGGISERHKERIEDVANRVDVRLKLTWAKPEVEELYDLPTGLGDWTYLSKAMYLRLFAPALVSAPKVIYLDSDTLAQDNLETLWATDLGAYPVAAVTELSTTFEQGNERYKAVWQAQKLDPNAPHFNSGVMVINLEVWRANQFSRTVFASIKHNRSVYRYPDQDALNAVFHKNWLELDTKWNYQITYEDLSITPIPANEVGIFHYSTPFKPWLNLTFREKRPYFVPFLRALRRSQWFSEPDYLRFCARLGVSYAKGLPKRVVSRLKRVG